MGQEGHTHLGTLVGSLRSGSYSRVLAQSLTSLAPTSVEIAEMPSIRGIPLFDQDILDRDGVPRQVEMLAEAIRVADGIIIVSPEYNWSIPGVLKNALDWISRLKRNPLQAKPVTIFTCSPGLLGGARAHPPIRNVLHSLDCRILARPEVQISQIKSKISSEPPAITDATTADFVAKRLDDFARFAMADLRVTTA